MQVGLLWHAAAAAAAGRPGGAGLMCKKIIACRAPPGLLHAASLLLLPQ